VGVNPLEGLFILSNYAWVFAIMKVYSTSNN